MARKGVQIKNKGLFSTSTTTQFAAPSARASFDGFSSTSGSLTTGSFDFSAPGSPLSSTQQLPIDWSRFERHTFFDSAESKVNVAFDTFINYFPFDSTVEEINKYIDGLTGYERYLFDNLWPKSLGYLHFSGTQKDEDPANGYAASLGTHINVVDQAGYLYPSISSRQDAAPIIDFSTSPFTCAFHINIPNRPVPTYNSVVLQKISPNHHGFSIFLKDSAASSPTTDVVFLLSSGSMALSASAAFSKSSDKFEHCAVVLSRKTNENPQLLIYKDAVLVGTSSQTANIGRLDFVTASLSIGSGSNHYLGTYSTNFESKTTLSGTLDDLRIYGSEKNVNEIKSIASGSLTFGSDLLAYYKFNEATGSYDNNSVVLDHSGNSLHGRITNFNSTLRDTTWGDQTLSYPIKNENVEYSPVLFPTFPPLATLNSRLLVSASNYDANNPNLITRMIPRHYLEEEASQMGFSNAKAGLGNAYSNTADFPGGGKIGSPQLIASLLFMWAKFFDEVKLFIDHFGSMLRIDYDDSGTIADVMLPFFAKYYGIQLPNMFADATIDQYLRGNDILSSAGRSQYSLAKIQAIIWRRILINVQDAMRSKGTIHGIKAIMRATGIEPDSMFRFRESGGSRELNLNTSRIYRNQTSSMLKFSNDGTLVSPFLSGSRIEVGTPEPRGTFVEKSTYKPHGISNWVWDGLLTSGSWTTEFIVKSKRPALITSMSLSRMLTSGTSGQTLIANCVGVGAGETLTTKTGSLSVFHRPSSDATIGTLELVLTGTNIFDGDVWHVSYGRQSHSALTSSYFLRAGKQSNGELVKYAEIYKTASFTNSGVSPKVYDFYSSGSHQLNGSGSFLQFGTGSIDTSSTAGLNSTSGVPSHAKVMNFSGSIGRVRFWSKALTEVETKEHIRNFTSLGVENPLLNFGFVNQKSGSFERLRVDAQCDQEVTQSDGAGRLVVFDYSQNMFHMTGTNFSATSDVIKPQDFQYSSLNPKFDERSATNKIRIAGYSRDSNVELYKTLKSPVRNIPLGTPVEDDTKFSIEISTSKALNDDILVLLGSLELFNDALGSPELMFASEYPDLESLRDVYFNRLTDKINYKNLLSFYKWVDTTIGFLIETMVPSNTSFQGLNFVIESHMLERNKMRYLQEDIYLGENDRRGLQTDLGLQQVVGSMKRY